MEVATHPKYVDNDRTVKYDIMLLKIEATKGIMPAKLHKNFVRGGKDVVAMGFGAANQEGQKNPKRAFNKLRDVHITTRYDKQCHKQYGNIIKKRAHLCAGDFEKGSCLCKLFETRTCFILFDHVLTKKFAMHSFIVLYFLDDSGGPLIIPGSPAEVIGLVSFNRGCKYTKKKPSSVYARVSGSYGWIMQRMCQMTGNKPADCKRRN